MFECLDVMTAVAEDGLDGLNGELTLLDENFRNRPAHFTKEDKDRLLVLRTFLSPLNRGERSENSGNPAEELDLFLQMLSVAPLLDHLTTAGADTEADYLDQLKKAPDVSSRYAFDDDAHDDRTRDIHDHIQMPRSAMPTLKSDNTVLILITVFISLLIMSVTFVSYRHQSTKKKGKYRVKYSRRTASSTNFQWIYSFFGIDSADDNNNSDFSDNDTLRRSNNKHASKKDREKDVTLDWLRDVALFVKQQWRSLSNEINDAVVADSLLNTEKKEKERPERIMKKSKFAADKKTEKKLIQAFSASSGEAESVSESDADSEEHSATETAVADVVNMTHSTFVQPDRVVPFTTVGRENKKIANGTKQKTQFDSEQAQKQRQLQVQHQQQEHEKPQQTLLQQPQLKQQLQQQRQQLQQQQHHQQLQHIQHRKPYISMPERDKIGSSISDKYIQQRPDLRIQRGITAQSDNGHEVMWPKPAIASQRVVSQHQHVPMQLTEQPQLLQHQLYVPPQVPTTWRSEPLGLVAATEKDDLGDIISDTAKLLLDQSRQPSLLRYDYQLPHESGPSFALLHAGSDDVFNADERAHFSMPEPFPFGQRQESIFEEASTYSLNSNAPVFTNPSRDDVFVQSSPFFSEREQIPDWFGFQRDTNSLGALPGDFRIPASDISHYLGSTFDDSLSSHSDKTSMFPYDLLNASGATLEEVQDVKSLTDSFFSNEK